MAIHLSLQTHEVGIADLVDWTMQHKHLIRESVDSM